jgi:hypothetical protein
VILNRTPDLMAAARVAVAAALRVGLLRRAKFCAECGTRSDRLDGHHADYSKPLMLEWLCRSCHHRRHTEHLAEAGEAGKRVRPRCVRCRRLIYLHLIDNGRFEQTPEGPAHSRKCKAKAAA